MKTRVAIVLPGFSYGGAEMMVSRLASHLDTESVEAEVICIYGSAKNNELERAVTDHGIPIRYIGKGKGFSAGAVRKLFGELDRFQPDVVHTHLSACVYCAPWVAARKKKMLHTVHNMPSHELIKPKRMLMRLLYKTGRAVPVGISAEIRALTEDFYHPKSGTELIYNPVDVNRFASAEAERGEGFSVINVGRLSEQKNQKLLIRAFSMLHKQNGSARLTILGDGPLRHELEKTIAEEGLEEAVRLEGNVTDTEKYYAKADLFVLSSVYEGLPLAVLEAMAASLPIVSTDVGGVRDIVKENGILTENGSCEQLYEAMLDLMEHPEKRLEMGRRSFDEVLKYDSSVTAGLYAGLYGKYAENG